MDDTTLYTQVGALVAQQGHLLTKAAGAVADNDVSDYPIFVMHHDEMEVGLPLLAADDEDGWQVRLSTLEEFSAKQLILPDRVAEFQAVYKTKRGHFCIFVVTADAAQFVFAPQQS